MITIATKNHNLTSREKKALDIVNSRNFVVVSNNETAINNGIFAIVDGESINITRTVFNLIRTGNVSMSRQGDLSIERKSMYWAEYWSEGEGVPPPIGMLVRATFFRDPENSRQVVRIGKRIYICNGDIRNGDVITGTVKNWSEIPVGRPVGEY